MPRLAAAPEQIRATVLAMLAEAGDVALSTAALVNMIDCVTPTK